MAPFNENILIVAGVILVGMLLAVGVFTLCNVLTHLENRLSCRRYLKDVDLQIAKENVKVAHLRYGLRAPFLSLPKDFDFPVKE